MCFIGSLLLLLLSLFWADDVKITSLSPPPPPSPPFSAARGSRGRRERKLKTFLQTDLMFMSLSPAAAEGSGGKGVGVGEEKRVFPPSPFFLPCSVFGCQR